MKHSRAPSLSGLGAFFFDMRLSPWHDPYMSNKSKGSAPKSANVAAVARVAGQEWMERFGGPSDCSDAELIEQAVLMAEFYGYGCDHDVYVDAFIAGALSMCV